MTEDLDEETEPARPPMVDPLAEAQLLAAMLADALERARIQRNFDALAEFSPFSVIGRGGRPIGDEVDPGWLPLIRPPRAPALRSTVDVPRPRTAPPGIPSRRRDRR